MSGVETVEVSRPRDFAWLTRTATVDDLPAVKSWSGAFKGQNVFNAVWVWYPGNLGVNVDEVFWEFDNPASDSPFFPMNFVFTSRENIASVEVIEAAPTGVRVRITTTYIIPGLPPWDVAKFTGELWGEVWNPRDRFVWDTSSGMAQYGLWTGGVVTSVE